MTNTFLTKFNKGARVQFKDKTITAFTMTVKYRKGKKVKVEEFGWAPIPIRILELAND